MTRKCQSKENNWSYKKTAGIKLDTWFEDGRIHYVWLLVRCKIGVGKCKCSV